MVVNAPVKESVKLKELIGKLFQQGAICSASVKHPHRGILIVQDDDFEPCPYSNHYHFLCSVVLAKILLVCIRAN